MKILHYTLGFPPLRSGGLVAYANDIMQEQINLFLAKDHLLSWQIWNLVFKLTTCLTAFHWLYLVEFKIQMILCILVIKKIMNAF